MALSYRGPPGDAALMWHATPMFTAFDGTSWGPLVGLRQLGFEHCIPARRARASLTLTVKSSRILATIKSSNASHHAARFLRSRASPQFGGKFRSWSRAE